MIDTVKENASNQRRLEAVSPALESLVRRFAIVAR